MRYDPVLTALVATGSQFIVVGSSAVRDPEAVPRDLDLLALDSPDNRASVRAGLAAVNARWGTSRGRPVSDAGPTPNWMWTVATDLGPVDVFWQFADGTRYEDAVR